MEIEVKKRKFRGEDAHKVLSIRIPVELASRLDEIAIEANISRNELINILLTEGVKSVRIKE
ncbi:MAG: ribbon-helix-helix protein, CopG family [Firmicutes bacterium]|jgi:metal-responsive CopG/Arc/MetJ family transcriptional regulator|nr:ribbon-helix-helix protein, CopG family [Bacillota bacterium]NBI61812.1 ribbon-helix-helix protein, CopG family [Clostridiales bacterium]